MKWELCGPQNAVVLHPAISTPAKKKTKGVSSGHPWGTPPSDQFPGSSVRSHLQQLPHCFGTLGCSNGSQSVRMLQADSRGACYMCTGISWINSLIAFRAKLLSSAVVSTCVLQAGCTKSFRRAALSIRKALQTRKFPPISSSGEVAVSKPKQNLIGPWKSVSPMYLKGVPCLSVM